MYSVPLASSVKRRHDHGHDNDHIDARKKTRGAPISDEGSRDLKALLDDDVTPTTRSYTVRAGSVVTFLHPQDTTKVIKEVRIKKYLRRRDLPNLDLQKSRQHPCCFLSILIF